MCSNVFMYFGLCPQSSSLKAELWRKKSLLHIDIQADMLFSFPLPFFLFITQQYPQQQLLFFCALFYTLQDLGFFSSLSFSCKVLCTKLTANTMGPNQRKKEKLKVHILSVLLPKHFSFQLPLTTEIQILFHLI